MVQPGADLKVRKEEERGEQGRRREGIYIYVLNLFIVLFCSSSLFLPFLPTFCKTHVGYYNGYLRIHLPITAPKKKKAKLHVFKEVPLFTFDAWEDEMEVQKEEVEEEEEMKRGKLDFYSFFLFLLFSRGVVFTITNSRFHQINLKRL